MKIFIKVNGVEQSFNNTTVTNWKEASDLVEKMMGDRKDVDFIKVEYNKAEVYKATGQLPNG